MINRPRNQEISSIIKPNGPNRVNMIRKGMHTLGLEEVPNFDSRIARAGGQVRPLGMEIDARDPVLVALPRHYQLPVRQCSDLSG